MDTRSTVLDDIAAFQTKKYLRHTSEINLYRSLTILRGSSPRDPALEIRNRIQKLAETKKRLKRSWLSK